MRIPPGLIVVVLSVGFAACGGNTSTPSSPTAAAPAATTPAGMATGTSAAVTGTWVGTAADSSSATTGTCMGIPGGAAGNMTWNITETGPGAFVGTMTMQGYGGGRQMQVIGTIDGRTGTFTITMPAGTMPMMGSCGGQVNGTFNLDDMRVQMHGAYTGSTTCFGPFNNGQLTLNRK